ncbi:MAG: hypothetical protein ACXVH0_08110, partial [Thermoanaerobaculia bacterium]
MVGTLRQDPNLGVLFRENLRPVLDSESKQSLARVLGSLPEPAHRGALAALFVALFKGLRYAERARTAAEAAPTRKRALLVFSLLKGESESIASFISKQLAPRFPEGSAQTEGLRRIVTAIEAEVRKVMDVELVDVVLMKDADLVLTRLEDAAVLMRDLYQQSVTSLAETFSSGPSIMIPDDGGMDLGDHQMMIMTDPPRHSAQRRIVAKEFVPKVAQSMRPRIEELATRIVDQVAAAGTCDLVPDIAGLMPSYVI